MTEQVEFIRGLRLKNFSPGEILFLGASHEQNGLNAVPAMHLMESIVPTCWVLQLARTSYGKPINIISGYRSPAYNSSVGGSSQSLHMKFKALDCSCHDPESLWRLLKNMRDLGLFKGGLGLYPSFVHLDIRGSNADWTG